MNYWMEVGESNKMYQNVSQKRIKFFFVKSLTNLGWAFVNLEFENSAQKID